MQINQIFNNIYMFDKHLKPIKYIDKNLTTNDDINIIKGSVKYVYYDTDTFINYCLYNITNLDEKLKYDTYYILFTTNIYLPHYFVVLVENLKNKTIKHLLIEIKNEWYKLINMLNPVYDTHDKNEKDALLYYNMYDFTIYGYIDQYPLIKFKSDFIMI